MPEYLSPGVFIEEVPARLKAIEGVSTSTAAFVGQAERGPVAGLPLPYTPAPTDRVVVPPDPTPVLVTSFADFTRRFGGVPTDPAQSGYLAHAVLAFFDNGGKRCFIGRVVDRSATGATRAFVQVSQGAVLRLARRASPGDTVVFFTSLRGIRAAAPNNTITFRQANGTAIGGALTVNAYDTAAGSVTLAAALTQTLEPDQVFAEVAAVTVSAAAGPRFYARNPGAWGANLRVLIANADRGAVRLPTGAIGNTVIQVASVGTFYRGAIIEVDYGGGNTQRSYHAVTDIQAGNRLTIAPGLTTGVAGAGGFARVVEIDITVEDQATGAIETFPGLSWNPDTNTEVRARHYSTAINTRSTLVYAQPPGIGGLAGSEAATLDRQPMRLNGFPVGPTAANAGSNGAAPTDTEIVGTDGGPGARTGIESLKDAEDIRIIAAPGRTSATVQNALVSQCERMRYRFAVLDARPDPSATSVIPDILAHRNVYDTSFAAYYTPWVEITVNDRIIALPPSGHVAGIYARVDNERGVYKAPANEVVRGITGLAAYITTGEQDLLNPRGVNAIRRFEGRGIRVWGARTLSSDPEFRYVNVRRFLIYLEASLDRGTQWVVFEPNTPDTWSRVVDSVSAFLHSEWRNGALFGRRPEDAFFVRCDETTMSAQDIQTGRLICLIGVAIVRPAEFVIFRIEQITGFSRRS